MNKLKDNWLTDGLIDYEFKKYQLLAYFYWRILNR
jgi:hypothetical protein